MSQKLAILGSTGSIGTQTLDIVSQNPDDLQVVAMSCGKNIDLFEKQIIFPKDETNVNQPLSVYTEPNEGRTA